MSKETSGKKVILNSIIYSCSGLLLKCFSFFLLPLYTAYLSTEDYGITSVATTFIGTMSFVVAFSLYSAIKRFYVDYKEDPEKLRRFYGTVCTFVFLSGIVFSGLFYVFRDALSKYVFSGVDFYPIILVCIISLVFECQHTIFSYILKSQQKALKSSVFSIAYFMVTLVLNILFVVVLRMGAVGSLLATMLGYILYTVYFVIEMSVKKTIRFCLDIKVLKDALKYSVPIMPHNLSTHIATLISKVLIGNAASLASLGVYSVASQFGHIADTIQSYVSQAYGPWLFEKLHAHAQGYKAGIRKISGLLSAVIGLFLLGIALFAQDYILLLVDPAYADAWRYVPLIVVVFAIKTMYYFYVEILFYYKKASKLLFTATLSGSLLNLLLSAFMIPMWGVYGSILADMIAMVLRVGIVVLVSKRFEDIGLRLWDFIANLIIVCVFVFAGLAPAFLIFGNTFSLANFGYKVLVVAVYVAVLLLRYRKDALRFVKKIKKKIGRKAAK